jgi:superfamily II DNA or RNA helicase/HKD family nuclease
VGGDDELRDGVYERLITAALEAKLRRLGAQGHRVERDTVEPAEAPAVLAQYLGALVRQRLEGLTEEAGTAAQIALANQILELLRTEDVREAAREEHLLDGPERLLEILRPAGDLGIVAPTPRPAIALATADVLLGDRGELSAGRVIEQEFPSADRVDLICSFLKWSGYRLLRDALRAHVRDRGRPLRVLTTTYVGVTEGRVLDDLRALGAEVRVSYEHQRTRLHAKAWIFHRPDGLSTAVVGSSNVTHSALVDGLEWNVRLAERVMPDALRKLASTFDAYWDGDEFEAYETGRDRATFDSAIAAARGHGGSMLRLLLDLTPHTFQQEMLDHLDAERLVHGRHRNLVVAATGTGKTVVAALDFARLRREHPDWRLLFVAHRREILEQARDTYRHALRDVGFGDLLGDGEAPRAGTSVFAMIQSLGPQRLVSLDPQAFEVVVVDEFHHAAADSYRALLEHVRPVELLGLTATPERADGVRVQDAFFGGRIAAELRLWDALDRGLLVPFHYFGVADGTDLRALHWSGGYETSELSNLYTGNDVRLRAVLRGVEEYVPEPGQMRALGFCAGVAHARWMAERFEASGLAAAALSGDSPHDERDRVLANFRAGRLRAVFTADLFNEGIDLPETDVLLLLRPTDSHVLFQQQLGRGLRRAVAAGKSCLTVLDFVGHQHRRFQMHRRLAALCGAQTRQDVATSVQSDFPSLPPGCAMRLEPQARHLILDNLRQAIGADVRTLERELRELGPTTSLAQFLARTGVELAEVYRADRSWSMLRRRAGHERRPEAAAEARLRSGIGRLLHLDDAQRLRWMVDALRPTDAVAERGSEDARRWQMLEVLLTAAASRGEAGVAALRADFAESAVLTDELRELASLLLDRVERPTFDTVELPAVPLKVHASYTTREALAALGQGHRSRIDQGVFHLPELRADVFFVTLSKTEKEYSPTTLYRDYAISPVLFHWQSQSTTSSSSETGRRYVEHRERGHQILLFARQRRHSSGIVQPYVFLGAADHHAHQGSRPISIVWRLRRPMPPAFFREAALVRATA